MISRFLSPLLRLMLATSLTFTTLSVGADTLLIDAITNSPPNDPSGVPRPTNGQTMKMVLARFGEPGHILPPVGNPPITRWIYSKFTVYFEHKLVVNSALHLDPANQ